ncbi:MAG TPA: hypothetical protein VHE37_10890 [Nevskiaceae bacterium]|nr:hypothetical protein [Nevskiaceae bacterium]
MSKPNGTLWLHIGTEKTGTTSIQRFLHDNRKRLLQAGVFVPSSLGHENHKMLAAYALELNSRDIALRSQNVSNSPADVMAFQAKVRKKFTDEVQAARFEHCVVSTEDLQRLYQDSEINRLFALLRPLFARIVVVLYLRRQDVLATSRRYTLLLHGDTNSDVFPKKSDNFYDYHSLVTRWTRQVADDDMCIVQYRERVEGVKFDALTSFCEVIGIPLEGMVMPKLLNVSLDATNQLVMLALNRQGDTVDPALRKFVLDQLGKYSDPSAHFVSRRQAEEFYQRFAAGNDQLAQRFLKREQLFSTDFSMYPEENQYRKVSEAAMSRLLEILAASRAAAAPPPA